MSLIERVQTLFPAAVYPALPKAPSALTVRPAKLRPDGDLIVHYMNLELRMNNISRGPYAEDFTQNRVFFVFTTNAITITRVKKEYHTHAPEPATVQANPSTYLEVIDTLTINQDQSLSSNSQQIRHNGKIVRLGPFKKDAHIPIMLNAVCLNLGRIEEILPFYCARGEATFYFARRKLVLVAATNPRHRHTQAIREGLVFVKAGLCTQRIEFFLIEEKAGTKELSLRPIGTVYFADGILQKEYQDAKEKIVRRDFRQGGKTFHIDRSDRVSLEDILDDFGAYVYSLSSAITSRGIYFNNLFIHFERADKRYLFEEDGFQIELCPGRGALQAIKRFAPADGKQKTETYTVRIDPEGCFLRPDGKPYLKNGKPVSVFEQRKKTVAYINFWDVFFCDAPGRIPVVLEQDIAALKKPADPETIRITTEVEDLLARVRAAKLTATKRIKTRADLVLATLKAQGPEAAEKQLAVLREDIAIAIERAQQKPPPPPKLSADEQKETNRRARSALETLRAYPSREHPGFDMDYFAIERESGVPAMTLYKISNGRINSTPFILEKLEALLARKSAET